MMTEDNPLIRGIITDAKAKAEAIEAKAGKEAEDIISEAEEKARHDAAAEKRVYELRLEQIGLREESARKNIDRLSELRSLDAAYTQVMDEVSRRLDEEMRKPSFRDVLSDWIAEAAIGLDRREARVAYSQKTPVDEDMLRSAEEKVRKAVGAEVSLSLDSEMLSAPGVVVTSIDGKVSYNNQLDVRMRRYSRDIRRIVQEENARQNSR